MSTPISKRGKVFTGFFLSFFCFLISIYPPCAFAIFLFLIPFLFGILHCRNLRHSFTYGLCFGLLYFSLASFWITNVQGWIFVLAITYHGLFMGAFAAGAKAIFDRTDNRLIHTFTLPSLWIICEWLRSIGFLGLPTGLAGYQLTPYLPLLQVAEFTGIYGLSFCVILVNVLIFSSFTLQHNKQRILPLTLLTAGLILWWAWGNFVLEQRAPENMTIKVAVIQNNTPNQDTFNESAILAQLKEYTDSSLTALTDKPDLIIWPETAVPCFLFHPQRRDILTATTSAIRRLNTPLLTGTEHFYIDQGQKTVENSAALFAASGKLTGRYAKIKLVPFMEYAPFGWLINPLRSLGLPCIYSPGKNYTLLNLGETQFSSVICFETLFPGLIRRFTNEGAEFFINLTNDSRALGTMDFYYNINLDMVRLRAIENRRSFVRAANTGISAIIDPNGRVRSYTKINIKDILSGEVIRRQKRTIYAQYGDWIVIGAALMLSGSLMITRKNT